MLGISKGSESDVGDQSLTDFFLSLLFSLSLRSVHYHELNLLNSHGLPDSTIMFLDVTSGLMCCPHFCEEHYHSVRTDKLVQHFPGRADDSNFVCEIWRAEVATATRYK